MPAKLNRVDNCYVISSPHLSESLSCDSFDNFQAAQSGQLKSAGQGRAPVAVIQLNNDTAVLKHYYRGGMIARVSKDRFLNTGVNSSRAVAEYRLLEWMTQQQLPVPQPLGARVLCHGAFYTCDLITRLIPDTMTLASKLADIALPDAIWSAVGGTIKTIHQHKVWHSDLNANNILIDNHGQVTIIDFDRCCRKQNTGWEQGNLKRLKRSLDKLTRHGSVKHFNSAAWQSLLNGYQRQ